MHQKILIFIFLITSSYKAECQQNSETMVGETKGLEVLKLLPEIITSGKLIHRGIYSPDFEEFYYTISDVDYSNFEVMCLSYVNGNWSGPYQAFFNSPYNDHGMSFSPDGKFLYFSSTRPVDRLPETWHIWRSENIGGKWSEPEYVDIPNLKNKLLSHPTITSSGELYFHSGNTDYSEMDVYRSVMVNGAFQEAVKVIIPDVEAGGKGTPYVAADGRYLIFAAIEDQLNLKISFRDKEGNWGRPHNFTEEVNTNGQGNPYITPDENFLLFATGKHAEENKNAIWQLKSVSMDTMLSLEK